jgi:hypothetical protein
MDWKILMETIEKIEVHGNHHEIGRAIGLRFSAAIHQFFDNYDFLQNQLLPFTNTSSGQRLYQAYLKIHQTRFPEYMAELEGMAEGAARPFEDIFLANLRGELAGLIAQDHHTGNPSGDAGSGCTDCLVLTPDAALIGHNEDGPSAGLGNMFIARIAVDGCHAFHALCYPGFLPGNASGFNESGILQPINHVAPQPIKVGASRHFLARSLLDAKTLDQALQSITVPDLASGFNYNIGSLSERRVVSVEVAPESHHVHEVQGCYTHTNHYFQLKNQKQAISWSSRKRLDRTRNLCRATIPADADHVLALLSDQTDRDYPIYRDATPPDEDATLCSALYDLDNRELRIYWDHPIRKPEENIKIAL